ncbi:ABC transporter permease [Marinobacter halodurans]|uniref:ABC transporter permease n=1 Tax=Marinobacter halodurans TaxID=2528979 RepID=A0ABY1ZRV7_9GAMM|nr:ABC transporter permease [Marinobacter halodurans]TBW59022.1 ABC transporter permease [Marinobacter halodurans]
MTTADGKPLKVSLRRALRRQRIWAFLLVAPLLLFILVTFIVPVFNMALRGIENPQVHDIMPQTTSALKAWDGEGLPAEPVYAALVADLQAGYKSKEIGKVATRLNYEKVGMRSVIMSSARHAKRMKDGPYKEAMIHVNRAWGDPATWRLIKRESAPYTFSYLLAALDAHYDDNGDIAMLPQDRRIYVPLFIRTLLMSATVTLFCILLGYPVAYLLANLPLKISNLLMIMVLLPFWTSLLVRTTTWIVLLQSQGVLNDLMVWLHVIDDQGRIQMIFNKTGTLVAMTHILLPFMILPLYSVMKTVPPSYLRAARSLGANPLVAFWRVYVPQTVSGIGAGSLLVFILSIGYYITPALVGGQSGQMISNMIAYHMQESLNWGLAGALGLLLLVIVLVLYSVYNKFIGIDKIKMG